MPRSPASRLVTTAQGNVLWQRGQACYVAKLQRRASEAALASLASTGAASLLRVYRKRRWCRQPPGASFETQASP